MEKTLAWKKLYRLSKEEGVPALPTVFQEHEEC